MATARFIRSRAEEGFTLVELMIVVLIIGILIAIALPTFLGARQRAANRAAQEDLRTGLVAALTHQAAIGAFDGFDVPTAKVAEPAVNWVGPGPPSPGQVAIQVALGQELLLITQSKTGEYFCVSQQANSPVTDRGGSNDFTQIDTVPECIGGW